jgi:hypothetical protein
MLLLAKVDTLVEEVEAARHLVAELEVLAEVVTQTVVLEMLTPEAGVLVDTVLQIQDLMEDLEL